jgi:hypothetical protein
MMNLELADFVVPILFWVIALIWGICTCVKAGSWQPLKDGIGVAMFLYFIPAGLFVGIWALNEWSGGNLKEFFGYLLAVLFGIGCIISAYCGIRDWFADRKAQREDPDYW